MKGTMTRRQVKPDAQVIPFPGPAADAPPFDPVKIEFDYTNDKWCRDNLVPVRFAIAIVGKDYRGMVDATAALEGAELDALLHDLAHAQEHLKGLSDICGVAWVRCQIAMNARAEAG
jgi:hypothetical protein